MKKLSLCLFLCLCLCLSLGLTAFAAAEGESFAYVTDAAGILSEQELQSLEESAARISAQYGCAVYIVTLPDYKTYNNESVERCAEELYHYFDLGWGEDRDGLILLLSMAERDYDLWGYGPYAKYTFTEYALNRLEQSFLPYFRQNDWYGGFQAYLRCAEQALIKAAQGEPESYQMPLGLKAAASLGPASLIGFLVCGIFKGQMKTAKEKVTAEDYVVSGSARLHVKEDQFLNRTRTVHVIESNPGGGGGRPSGGGTSHHSGKF